MLVFAAKESLYKALYPRVQRYVDFLDARLVRFSDHLLTLELLVTLTPGMETGLTFDCHFAVEATELLTVIALRDD